MSDTAKTSDQMRDEITAMCRADAAKAFARHEIKESGENRWQIWRRDESGRFESVYWAEIAVMGGGYLYVNGDIDLVVFGRSSYEGRARIAWMAKASEVYASEKVSIGMTPGKDNGPVWDWEMDVAVARVREDLTPDDDGESALTLPSAFDDVDDAIEDLKRQDSTREAFNAWLYEHFDGDDLDGVYDAGDVLSSRVIFAQAALARLLELLDRKEDGEAK